MTNGTTFLIISEKRTGPIKQLKTNGRGTRKQKCNLKNLDSKLISVPLLSKNVLTPVVMKTPTKSMH